MTLRKYALLSLALLAILPGCEKSFVSDDEIAFSPLNQKATKAIMTGTTYTDKGFVVHAWRNGELYFQDALAINKDAQNLWYSSNITCYWPVNGSLKFFAVSPYDAPFTIDSDGRLSSTGTYAINDEGKWTNDICFGEAEVTDCSAHPDAVPLVFKHALSRISFFVKTQANYSNGSGQNTNTVKIAVNSISLKNINTTAQLTGGAWTGQTTAMDFDNLYNTTGEGKVLSTTAEEITGYDVLMLPQTLRADAAIEVVYTVTQTVVVNGKTTSYSSRETGTAKLGGNGEKWEMGKRINLIISVGLEPIKLSAGVSEWDEKNLEGLV